MATIVIHKDSGKYYVLIGTGYSFYKDSLSSFFGGVLLPTEEKGESMSAAISDEHGVISWVQTSELEVVEINGVKIVEILRPFLSDDLSYAQLDDSEKEKCPACEKVVSVLDEECPGCGLRLMD
jgi:hypothetical protein